MIIRIIYFYATESKSNITQNIQNTQNLIDMKEKIKTFIELFNDILIKEISSKDIKEEMRNFINLCDNIVDQISKVDNLSSLQELEKKFIEIQCATKSKIKEIKSNENLSKH